MTKNIQDLKNTLILDVKQIFLDSLIEAGASETSATETANLYTNMFIDLIDMMTKEWSEKIQESSVEEVYNELANEVAEFSKTLEKESTFITAKTFKAIFFAGLNTLRDEHYEESRKADAEEVMKYLVNKPIAMKKHPQVSLIDNPPEKIDDLYVVNHGLPTRMLKQNAKIFKQAAKKYLKDQGDKFEGLTAGSDRGRALLPKATIGNLKGVDVYETKDGFYCDVIFKDDLIMGTSVMHPAKTAQEALCLGFKIVASATHNSKNKFSLFN